MHKDIDITYADLKGMRDAWLARAQAQVEKIPMLGVITEVPSATPFDSILKLIEDAWLCGSEHRANSIRIGTLQFFTDARKRLCMSFESRFPVEDTGEGDEEHDRMNRALQTLFPDQHKE